MMPPKSVQALQLHCASYGGVQRFSNTIIIIPKTESYVFETITPYSITPYSS